MTIEVHTCTKIDLQYITNIQVRIIRYSVNNLKMKTSQRTNMLKQTQKYNKAQLWSCIQIHGTVGRVNVLFELPIVYLVIYAQYVSMLLCVVLYNIIMLFCMYIAYTCIYGYLCEILSKCKIDFVVIIDADKIRKQHKDQNSWEKKHTTKTPTNLVV
jgi:hypothetical protein